MKKNEPKIPLWEEIWQSAALDLVRSSISLIPKAEVSGRCDDTYWDLAKLKENIRNRWNVQNMPLRLRTRFYKIIPLDTYYNDEAKLICEWKLGKEYHHLRKKL